MAAVSLTLDEDFDRVAEQPLARAALQDALQQDLARALQVVLNPAAIPNTLGNPKPETRNPKPRINYTQHLEPAIHTAGYETSNFTPQPTSHPTFKRSHSRSKSCFQSSELTKHETLTGTLYRNTKHEILNSQPKIKIVGGWADRDHGAAQARGGGSSTSASHRIETKIEETFSQRSCGRFP